MAPPNISELNALTKVHIMPGIADGFFKAGPLMAYLKSRFRTTFPGGSKIQEQLLYSPLRGKAYKIGESFDITKKQTKTAIQFDMKYYEVSVPEYTEEVEVLVRGPEAVLDLVAVDLGNAALTMSALLEIDSYGNGQNIGGNDRTALLNGLEEYYTDQTNLTYAGNTITSYGGQPRVDVGSALNSPTGLIDPNAGPAMSYHVLEHSFNACKIGKQVPKVGITSNRCESFIMEQFEPQRRITMETEEPEIGWPGIKFKNATILASQYIPSQDFPVADAIELGYSPADAADLALAYEILIWMNPGTPGGNDEQIRLHMSASKLFQFGFTGFKVAQDSTVVAGQQLFAGNIVGRAPRYGRIIYGFVR
jgi:hypothetical protein